MELIRNCLRILWRIWFYVFFAISIIIMLPFLFIFTLKEKYYTYLYKVIRVFSKTLIFCMGFRLKKEIEVPLNDAQSYMFCPNHTSMLDPFILISMVKKPIVFVGKSELKKIPVFGFFYKRTCILVDRSSTKSRREVYLKAKSRLKNGTSVAIFPEGLVPTEDVVLSPFKNGAFSLAIEHQIPIVPAIYYDCKRLFSWTYFKGNPGVLRVKQFAPISTKNIDKKEINSFKKMLFDTMYEELVNDADYMKDTKRILKK